MIDTSSRPNRAPTVAQLVTLANRASRKTLSSAEVLTLHCGIEALATAAVETTVAAVAPAQPSRREVRLQRQFNAAVRLYAGAYGLTVEQAMGEIRAEAER